MTDDLKAPEQAAKTPVSDLVKSAINLMAQGGSMRIMDIPDDRSFASHTFGGDVSLAIADLFATLEAALADMTQQRDAAIERADATEAAAKGGV